MRKKEQKKVTSKISSGNEQSQRTAHERIQQIARTTNDGELQQIIQQSQASSRAVAHTSNRQPQQQNQVRSSPNK